MSIVSDYSKYISSIIREESQTRIALSRRYPKIVPLILLVRRTYNSAVYRMQSKYRLKREVDQDWYNTTEHSAPLYRKYNKPELDLGKIQNIHLAIQQLDGLIIPPGKVFSFWKEVGNPTTSRGYKTGLILSDGALQEGIGGGLCQLSNFIAYMFACTECVFIKRAHHSRDVFPDSGRNIPFASGATVFFNLIDLQIKNTTQHPIQIKLRMTKTQLRGSLSSSIKQDYKIKLQERAAVFLESPITGFVYRCNEIHKIYVQKHTKQTLQTKILWRNVAKVLYDKSHISKNILQF